MSAAELFETERPIQRWDREPSEFWEALTRITAELRYDPADRASRLPDPHGPVRYMATGTGFSQETKRRLCLLVTQLPWILPSLEHWLKRSRVDGLQRIDYYRRLFSEACEQIDLSEFPMDEFADPETQSQQIDALSRAMLLKSELLLIVGQFDLLRQEYRERRTSSSSTRLKIVA